MAIHVNRIPRAARTAALLVALLGGPASGWGQAIEEITVTTRKITENVKEVPLAITAFDSDTIEAAAITSLNDVAALTPGLSFFNAFGESLPVPVIRGVVPTDIFGQNATAIFVDGVYVSGREGLNFSQLDIERIEVVKGPQSALYGRNAFSGAINYVTKRPSEIFESKTELEAGNEGKQRGMLVVSGPILGKSLRGRASVLYDEWDGSYENPLGTSDDDVGGYRYRSYQGSLLWMPAESLEISAALYRSNDEIDDTASAGLPANCENRVDSNELDVRYLNVCGEVPDLDEIPTMPDNHTIPKIEQALGEDRDIVRGNLNITWDSGFGTFTSLTGYSHTEQSATWDYNRNVGHQQPFWYCPDAIEVSPAINSCVQPADQRFYSGLLNVEFEDQSEEWSQEIRFTSPQDRSVRFSVGGYYYNVDMESLEGGPIATRPLPEGEVGLAPFAPCDPNYPDEECAPNLAIGSAIYGLYFTPDGGLDPLRRPDGEGDTDTEAWAIFGATDYDFTDRLTGRVELRYSHEAQDARLLFYTECALISGPLCGDPPPVNGDDVYNLEYTAALPSCDPGQLVLDPPVCSPGDTDRFSSVTGRVGLKYQVNPEWMVYGSIAKGEKPGGIRLVEVGLLPPGALDEVEDVVNNPFDPEEILAYELGIKGVTADGRLGLDLSMFYNDWTDIVLRQLLDTDPESGYPLDAPTGFNFNAGDARVWGWEATADLAFTNNFSGRFTVGWSDAELTNARQDTYAAFPSFRAPGCEDFPADPDMELPNQHEVACLEAGGDVSGNQLLRQPEWTASTSLTYERPLFGDWTWFSRADANYQDKVYVGNENQGWVPSHTYVNLRLGVESARYSVELWGRNIFEDDNAISAFRDVYIANTEDFYPPTEPFEDAGPRPSFDHFVPLRYTISYPKLRTYGLTVKVRFGGAER